MRSWTGELRWGLQGVMVALLALWVAGCSTTPAAFLAPPAPTAGRTAGERFYVQTSNYYYLYTRDTRPFDEHSQFADAHYPIPLSYETKTAEPAGFSLVAETVQSIQSWALADPRVAVISGVPVGRERIHIILVNGIDYNGATNIIGLTKLIKGGSNPHFEVYVTITDPITNAPMTNTEIAKTLTHEIGHTLGLGHSPDDRDLMHYRASGRQGATRNAFLTYGDAMALWCTLSTRRINWDPARPAVVEAGGATTSLARGRTRVTEKDGTVVCVYTRQ